MRSLDDAELEHLRGRLAEAEDALQAIRGGEVDAIVVEGPAGPVVYTLKTADTPYRLLVEQMREGALTVSTEGIILYANAAFARMVDLAADRLRGVDLMELIADAADRNPSRLFGEAGSSGLDVRLRTSRGEVRNVYMSSTPLTIHDTEVQCVIATDLTRQELRRRHEAIVNSSADAIYSLSADGIVTTWNAAAERLYGYTPEEIIGRKVDVLFGTQEPAPGLSATDHTIEVKQFRYETVQVAKSGERLEVAISAASLDEEGIPKGVSVIARDVSERNRAQNHIRFLLQESAHRTRNLLAVIQAIATQTARAAETVEDFEHSFSLRLHSMAVSHDMLLGEGGKRASVAELVRLQLQPFAEVGSRLTLDGPDVSLTPDAGQHVGLALHELATNAAKYGAWSSPTGRVTVSWEVHDNGGDDGLRLGWRESNGPRVAPRTRLGFGSVLTEYGVANALDAKVTVEFAPEGFRWIIEIPSSCVVSGSRLKNKG
jgi:PAS domain S-box-containing protein